MFDYMVHCNRVKIAIRPGSWFQQSRPHIKPGFQSLGRRFRIRFNPADFPPHRTQLQQNAAIAASNVQHTSAFSRVAKKADEFLKTLPTLRRKPSRAAIAAR
jgi:hypothetical protein